MQDWVEDVTLPVDQVVTDGDDSAKVDLVDSGKIFPVGDGHEEFVSRGTSQAESVIVIEGTDKYTPTSVMPRNVTRGVVTQIQQFEEALELITKVREVCTVCEYETPQDTRDQVSVMVEIHWRVVHSITGGGGHKEALVHDAVWPNRSY